MRIHYVRAYGRRPVLASSPVEADLETARTILNAIATDNGCLGVFRDDGQLVRFYAEDAAIAVEVGRGSEIRICRMNLPLAESVLDAVFDRVDPEQKIAFARLTWRSERRPNQSPEPTAMSVTPPAAQEPRQP
jgi:hypothetical protein